MEPVEGARLKQAPVEVRHCSTLAEYEECVRLQLITWGEDLVVPSGLFVVARETGGQTLGAFAGERMIGFTLGLAGFRGRQQMIHSHMTAVLAEFRDRGVGRMLKLYQRTDALARGIHVVEWTFDPLELKNAHFNINRLGAVVKRFLPNCYGITGSPLHAGIPTDRFMAEWYLDSPRVEKIMAGNAPEIVTKTADEKRSKDVVKICLPADISQRKQREPEAGKRVQSEIREQFTKYLNGGGFVVTGLEIGPAEANYILEREEKVAPEIATR